MDKRGSVSGDRESELLECGPAACGLVPAIPPVVGGYTCCVCAGRKPVAVLGTQREQRCLGAAQVQGQPGGAL